MAKAKGVSLNMTKQNVFDQLDELEPDVDYKALQGLTLIDAKEKYHIGLPRTSNSLARRWKRRPVTCLSRLRR
ncbi:MAG: hypothetical protein WHS46_04490 [Desulfosoma sp.]